MKSMILTLLLASISFAQTTQPLNTVVPRPNHPGPAIGINLDGSTYYSQAGAYVNVVDQFSGFYALGIGAVTYSNNHYPLSDAQAITYMRGYPEGDYNISWKGSGKLTLYGNVKSIVADHVQGDRIYRVTHIVPPNLRISFTQIDPKNPPDDLRIIVPGYDKDSRLIWRQRFVDQVKPFIWFRTLNLGMVNKGLIKTVSDVPTVAQFDKTGDYGIPYEYFNELARRAGCGIWICIPDQADDASIKLMLHRAVDGCDPNTIVVIENSNELWNGDMIQAQRNFAAVKASNDWQGKIINGVLHPEQGVNDNTKAARRIAERAKHLGDLAKAELPTMDVRPTLVGQTANPAYLADGLEWTTFKTGGSYFRAGSVGGYMMIGHELDGANWTMISPQQVIGSLRKNMTEVLGPQLAQNRAILSKYNVPDFYIYEGGEHIQFWGVQNIPNDPRYKAQEIPQMGSALCDNFTMFGEQGGVVFNMFTHIGSPANTFGDWSMLRTGSDNHSVKWDSVMGYMFWSQSVSSN